MRFCLRSGAVKLSWPVRALATRPGRVVSLKLCQSPNTNNKSSSERRSRWGRTVWPRCSRGHQSGHETSHAQSQCCWRRSTGTQGGAVRHRYGEGRGRLGAEVGVDHRSGEAGRFRGVPPFTSLSNFFSSFWPRTPSPLALWLAISVHSLSQKRSEWGKFWFRGLET